MDRWIKNKPKVSVWSVKMCTFMSLNMISSIKVCHHHLMVLGRPGSYLYNNLWQFIFILCNVRKANHFYTVFYIDLFLFFVFKRLYPTAFFVSFK